MTVLYLYCRQANVRRHEKTSSNGRLRLPRLHRRYCRGNGWIDPSVENKQVDAREEAQAPRPNLELGPWARNPGGDAESVEMNRGHRPDYSSLLLQYCTVLYCIVQYFIKAQSMHPSLSCSGGGNSFLLRVRVGFPVLTVIATGGLHLLVASKNIDMTALFAALVRQRVPLNNRTVHDSRSKVFQAKPYTVQYCILNTLGGCMYSTET